MNIYICDNCSCEFDADNDLFCPNCGIPVKEVNENTDEFFICPVCGSKNPKGERKCLYCCSLF